MSTKKEIVFDVVLESPGITESEIAKVIYGPSGYRQQVNKEVVLGTMGNSHLTQNGLNDARNLESNT